MSREIKANDLLERLENKTIPAGTRLKFTNKNNKVTIIAKVLENPHKYILENEDNRKALAANWLIGTRIELLEDNNIDIDSIEELNDTCYDKHFYGEDKEYYHNLTRKTLNQLIRLAKQHDREIKELKEK